MSVAKKVAIIDNLVGHTEFCSRGHIEFTPQELNAVTGGNTGNVAFVSGTRTVIANRQRVIGWGSNPDIVRRDTDHIVICCANQIGAHVDLANWAERLEGFDLPVTLLGLGAQTPTYEDEVDVPQGTIDFLNVVKKLDPSSNGNIGVRGEFTHSVLKKLGFDSVVTGCPSLFLSAEPSLGEKIAARKIDPETARLAVAAGNPHHAGSRGIEQLLMTLAERNNGAYIVQHPDLMIALGASMHSAETDEKIERLLHVFGDWDSVDALKAWFDRYGYAFWDSGNWTQFLRHYDAAIGPRFHGVALAVQAGIPGVVLNIDNRTKELANTSAIKQLAVSDIKDVEMEDWLSLLQWTDDDGQNFDENRRLFSSTVARFVDDNSLTPSKNMTQIPIRAEGQT